MPRTYNGEIITPVGDSNTATDHEPQVYHRQLFSLACANGKGAIPLRGPVIPTGPLNCASTDYLLGHDGYNGYQVSDTAAQIVSVMNTYNTQLIMLMIGTNNISPTSTPADIANFKAQYKALLDLMYATYSNVWIVPTTLPPCRDDAYNANIVLANAAILSLQASYPTATFVDGYTALAANPNYKTDYLSDNVHLNAAGQTVLRDVFYPALWPTTPPPSPGGPARLEVLFGH